MKNAVGITGGIGSGKSSVARWIAEKENICLLDADHEVKLLLEYGEPGWQKIYNLFGEEVLHSDKNLNKDLLRTIIFNDKSKRHQVENILHPMVLHEIGCKVENSFHINNKKCLVEVPLLFEAGWQRYFDFVIVVYASSEICCQRVMARDACSREEALNAINIQIPLMEKVKLADLVIDNDQHWASTLELLKNHKNYFSTIF